MQLDAATDQRGRQAHPPLELLDLAVEPSPEPGAPAGETGARPRGRRWAVGIAAAVVVTVGGALFVRTTSSPAPTASPPRFERVAAVAAELPAIDLAPNGLEGFAELYVSTYLTATGAARQSAIEQFYPAAPEMADRAVFDRYVTRAVVVGLESTGDEAWLLTISAEVLTFDGGTYVLDGLHHYAVAVTAPEGRPFAATSLPTRIAAPRVGEIPAVVAGTPVADPGVQSLAAGFVRTYTTGGSDLDRYTTADYAPVSIDPTPFERISVDDLTAVQIAPERLHVRAVGVGTPFSGSQIRIEYHLIVEVEGGAWKVAGLAPGPLTGAQLADAETGAQSG